MNILSLQSHVAYGHVGNSAAVFALQRLGIEVWPVHTVQFSNHPGYGGFRGRAFDAGLIGDVVQGIEERGALAACDGVLSGYVGSAEIGPAILDAVARAKRANPRALYCCDPVIGDTGRGVYVQPGVAEFIRQYMIPAADVATPNLFELGHLTGRDTRNMGQVLQAAQALRALGPRTVLVTSIDNDETPADTAELAVCDDTGAYRLRTPKLSIAANGTGDVIAALFLAHLLRTGSAADALSRSASSVFGILKRTAEARSREILLIEAQDELVNPGATFRAEQL
ncbi:MAG TPA: pyridoxal kinase PdxY [Xanthobacteraceae bacterium]|jgi:pyridoxine kinase